MAWDGYIDRLLARRLRAELVNPNYEYLQDTLKKRIGFDFKEFMDNINMKDSQVYEKEFGWKFFDKKSLKEYISYYSGGNHIEKVTTPTMIFHCEDDPIIKADVIIPEEIIKNDNILLAST